MTEIPAYLCLTTSPETLSILAGVLGLWAAFRANALAARMYLWSWLLLSLLGQVMHVLKIFSDYANIEKANTTAPPTASKFEHHWGAVVFLRLATLIWVMYCFKVRWLFSRSETRISESTAQNTARPTAVFFISASIRQNMLSSPDLAPPLATRRCSSHVASASPNPVRYRPLPCSACAL